VHILFLQLIIDPACSVVFEAEPLEPDGMTVPPRRPDQKLFDRIVMGRGLCQGAGLLVLLLGVYAGARAWLPPSANRDETARALTFVVLILSNLGLIHANRSWTETRLRGSAESNTQFFSIACATVAVLGAVLWIPAVGRLFSFAPPPPLALLVALCVAGLSLAWFELVKRMQVRRTRVAGG